MKPFYPLKHWLSTLLLAPFIPTVISIFYKLEDGLVVDLIEVYPITFVFSLFFSLPTMGIYCATFYYLSRSNIKIILAKTILILISVLGITITQLLIKGSMSFTIIYSFSIATIICGLLWRLRTNEDWDNGLQTQL
jgi:hypothetical protein